MSGSGVNCRTSSTTTAQSPVGSLLPTTDIQSAQQTTMAARRLSLSLSQLWLLVLISAVFPAGECSRGDRSDVFQSCLGVCVKNNCSSAAAGWVWSCEDDCKYDCMWTTVDRFVAAGVQVPQFYGKWPFVRLLGVQEPASALFSVANMAAHVGMAREFVQRVPGHAPLYRLWLSYALVCVNAWFWSAVFHAKDTPLTEKADYFCAFSMVLFSAYSACIRLLGPGHGWAVAAVTAGSLALMTYHVSYLAWVRFDYGYNMRANIAVGAVNVLLWLGWCWKHWRLGYVWRCAVSVLAVTLSLLLETADFVPIAYTLDAHALWHLSTSPLPLLWYRFLIDDCRHQLSRQKLLKKSV